MADKHVVDQLMMDLETQVKKGKDDVLQLKKQMVAMTEQIDKETNAHEDTGMYDRHALKVIIHQSTHLTFPSFAPYYD